MSFNPLSCLSIYICFITSVWYIAVNYTDENNHTCIIIYKDPDEGTGRIELETSYEPESVRAMTGVTLPNNTRLPDGTKHIFVLNEMNRT